MRWGRLGVIILAVTGAATHALAQAPPPAWPSLAVPPQVAPDGTKDAAVIIGIDEYVFVPHVEGATLNARDWFTFLVEGEKVPISRVHLLRNRDGSREQILSITKQAANEVEPGGRLWFIFIGHGAPAQDGKEGILIGVDAQQSVTSLYSRSVGQHEVVDAVSAGLQAQTLIVLDACFSGRTGGGAPLAEGLQPLLPVAAMEPPKNITILSAGSHDQFAGPLPGDKRPAFSYLVLGAMRGWGDSSGRGMVTVKDAVDYARLALTVLPIGRTQTPELHGADPTLALSHGGTEKGPSLEKAVAGTELPVVDTSKPAPLPTGPAMLRVRATCGNDPRAIAGQGGLKVVEITDEKDIALTAASDPAPRLKYDDATHQRVMADPDFVDYQLTAGPHRLRVSSTLCDVDEERVVLPAGQTVEFAPRLSLIALAVDFQRPSALGPSDKLRLVDSSGKALCNELPCQHTVPVQSHYWVELTRPGSDRMTVMLADDLTSGNVKGITVVPEVERQHSGWTWPTFLGGIVVAGIGGAVYAAAGGSCTYKYWSGSGYSTASGDCGDPGSIGDNLHPIAKTQSTNGTGFAAIGVAAVGVGLVGLGIAMFGGVLGHDNLDLRAGSSAVAASPAESGRQATASASPVGEGGGL